MVQFGRKKPKKSEIGKQIKKMLSATEKGKLPDAPDTRSRQELITEMFEEKLEELDMKPSSDSGYIPVSLTPLAQKLLQCGVSDEIVSAILAGLQEVESELSVKDIIDAAAESPEVHLTGKDLEEAKELAVDEWKRLRGLAS
jgi:hypothetical protein